jgi:hypothetical protein
VEEESRYGLFEPGDPTHPDLTKIYDYWLQKRGDRFAPAWADINLPELPPAILPRVCVVNVSPDKTDFTYRFWGTAITGMHQYDLTGKSLLNLKPAHYAKTIYRQYYTVFENKRPQGFLTEVPKGGGLYDYYAVIRLPLSSNGRDVDMLMSAEEYGDNRDQLQKIFNKIIEGSD